MTSLQMVLPPAEIAKIQVKELGKRTEVPENAGVFSRLLVDELERRIRVAVDEEFGESNEKTEIQIEMKENRAFKDVLRGFLETDAQNIDPALSKFLDTFGDVGRKLASFLDTIRNKPGTAPSMFIETAEESNGSVTKIFLDMAKESSRKELSKFLKEAVEKKQN